MHFRHISRIYVTILSMAAIIAAKTFTVSKDGRGAYTSIQAAVDDAGKNDIVKILDNAVYEEQVDLDSTKSGLLLTSANPTSLNKPTIRHKDIEHIKPRTCQEAHNEDLIDFDRNGALRLLRTRNITIDGIKVDGGGVFPFGANGIWDEGSVQCKWPLQHGNAAIAIWVSGDIAIRNCEISNAFIGISVKDRNEGGIYANANPADIEPWNVVPLSGFGKTGNHLIEHNRVHDNSWGMFFESTWDLGSVIRYNLLYENHHPDMATANEIKSLTSEGANQPGGAMWFKDHMLSPLAIYNNTFWHNYTIFAGHWRPGAQHLVFNNIYGEPFTYWGQYTPFQNPFHALDKAFKSRMWHCVYAAQSELSTRQQKVEAGEYDQGTQKYIKVDSLVTFYQPRITNDLGEPEKSSLDIELTIPLSTGDVTKTQTLSNVALPGGLLTKVFAAEAGIRWLETPFKSTDPADPDFLTPNWDNPNVQKYIVDQGWPEAGIRDADGTLADLGAIPSGGTPEPLATLKPLAPVIINGTEATIRFDFAVEKGSFNSPKIKYFRFIKNIAFQPDAFGGNVKPIPASDIMEITPSSSAVNFGENTFTVDIPARGDDDFYAFFEIIVEGTDANGKSAASTVGFMPYRKLDYGLEITIYDITETTKLDQVRAGDTVKLKIVGKKADGTNFLNTIDPAEVNLNSGADLLTHTMEQFSLPNGIDGGRITKPVVFTKVPQNGFEYVSASGLWEDPGEKNSVAFFGVSDAIRVLPGDPDKAIFEDPPSNSISANPPIIDPGQTYDVQVQVYDKFDNKINQATSVSIKSLHPLIGNVEGLKSSSTDTTGAVSFKSKVTNGALHEVYTLETTLTVNSRKDSADLKVGKARDKLWVYYSDTASYDPSVALRGNAGDERYPVVIAASTSGADILTSRTTEFEVTVSSGIAVYASESDSNATYSFSLKDGRITIWLRGTNVAVNGNISVAPVSDNTILSNTRENIYFTRQSTDIEKAIAYANNGFGKVDSLEIFYLKELKARPDSLIIYWPQKGDAYQKTVTYGISLDPSNAKQVHVSLPDPFPEELTTYAGSDLLGVHYWQDPSTPDLQGEITPFKIKDAVGPLLTSGQLVERVDPGNDTLYVTFTEEIINARLEGISLELIKQGASDTIALTIFEASQVNGTIRIVAKDEGDKAPAAGDSLRIIPDGPLTDNYANKAHALNRPIPLSIKPIAASIEQSWYVDANADGTVDAAYVAFAKAVDISTLHVSFTWTNNNSTEPLSDSLLSYASDSQTVRINLLGAFVKQVADQTSGEMSVLVVDSAFDGTQKTAIVQDSAAPVITSANFSPGAVYADQSAAPDTLVVAFSEGIAGTHAGKPYRLINPKSANEYTFTLDSLSWEGVKYRYLVSSIDGITFPEDEDSIWISAASRITDLNGNIQDNAGNRKTAMNVKDLEFKLQIGVTNNPFVPGKSRIGNTFASLPEVKNGYGTLVIVDPVVRATDDVALTSQCTIYDPLGNVIVANTEMAKDPNSNKRYLFWDGTNRFGRRVGSGSYLAMVRIDVQGKDTKVEQLMIGVAR
ncbi:MAG: hypothetical protein GF398_00535 [Chitinivibrionales bacterium]|nr:hypothetical protein [Chitinivibrionales bacterium]